MKTNLKNQKGITLVALVVTIIVLLILAGVSLSLVMGNEGILGRATEAVDTNTIASAGERAELLVAEAQTDYYEAKYVNETPTTQTMKAHVEAYLAANTTTNGEKVSIEGSKLVVKASNAADAKTIAERAIDDNLKLTGRWSAPAGGVTPTPST